MHGADEPPTPTKVVATLLHHFAATLRRKMPNLGGDSPIDTVALPALR
jgi:hypothetical protein